MKRRTVLLLLLLLLALSVPVAVTLRQTGDPERPAPPGTLPPSVPPVADGVASTVPEPVDPASSSPAVPPGVAPKSDARTGSRDPKPWKKVPDGYFGILTGWVVDLGTGDPIVGAKIAYGPFPSSWGTKTDAKGWFQLGINSGGDGEEKPWRIRVTATGYEDWETTPAEAQIRVELIPKSVIRMPGGIRGRVLDSEGRPLSGAVRVVLGDGEATNHYLAVHADGNGEFLLEAVEPGGWMIRHLNGKAVDVFVPEDGEVPITIRSKKTRDELDRESQHARKLEVLKQSVADAREAYAVEKARGAGANVLNRLRAHVEQAESRLGGHRKKVRRPEMSVTDVPAPDGTRLVFESTGGSSTERWWAVVKDGVARFPSLYPGRWTLTLMKDAGAAPIPVEVPAKGDLKFPK